MYDFSLINLYKEGDKSVTVVSNPTGYELVAKGRHGAVFKLSEDKCVKIFIDERLAEKEAEAYRRIGQWDVCPRIYETGPNYIIMEYIAGLTLYKYLRSKKEIPEALVKQILVILQKFKELAFKEKDFQLTNTIVDNNETLRLVDLVNAFEIEKDIPELLFQELSALDLLKVFMDKVRELDYDAYIDCSFLLIDYYKKYFLV